jgi:MSHA biogenesis protein MshQ
MRAYDSSNVIHALKLRVLVLLALLIGAPAATLAQPGTTLFYDNLNGNLNDFTVVASGGNGSIGNETASSGRSLRLRWGPVRVYTNPIAAAVPGADLTLWIRRGDDSFSEAPDSGEDLVIEYRDAGGSWIAIDTYAGDGSPGEIITPTYTLPAAALHANLSIQVRLADGDGSDNDYWHIDELRVTETAGAPGGALGIGSCDNFESGLGNWIISAGGSSASAGISSQTSNSPSNSLYTEGGVVSVTSNPFDLSGAASVVFDVWIRRGANSFSGRPENNENLVVEYLSNGGVWSQLETFAGGNPAGEIFVRSYVLPADALHAVFQIRFRQTGGSGNSDYWHVDDVCFAAVEPVFYSFEEDAWTGAAGEVLDGSSNGFDGTVFGGATNAETIPALAGNPGTCRYADFDGVDDYIEIPDGPAFDISGNLTVAAWINARSLPTGGNLHTIASKDWNYEFHLNSSGQIFWWWNDSGGTTRSFTTASSISLNQWHHVAITYTSGSQVIYVDGNVWATRSYTGNLRLNDLPFYIGTDWNFISRAFDGLIDEVYVVPQAYSQAEVQTLRDATHPCASVGAAFSINHNSFGIHCVAETITVNAIDAVTGTPLLNYNAQVELDTQSGNGTWSLISGGGTLVDAAADDGLATYDWPLSESQAQFALTYTQGVPTIDIDVVQVGNPGIRDTDAEGILVFSANGFTLTATPLTNPPPVTVVPFDTAQTAAVPFDVYIAAYGQTANDPVCGIIESYTGDQNLKFWSTYLDPVAGSLSVEVDGAAISGSEAGAANQIVTFSNGQALVSAKYKDAGSMQILVKDDTTINAELPGGIRGATSAFVSRPADFVLSNVRNGAGTIINPQAVDAVGPIFIAAGTDFQTTVTALDAEGDPTPNYGQEIVPESVRLDVELVAPVGGASPGIGAVTGFGAFAAGTATGFDFTWSEVGIMQLRPGIGDSDYLGAGDVSGSLSENIGRFVPNQFALAFNTPVLETQCTVGSFTYTGESFNYLIAPQITATAQSAGGSTTLNYTGSFFKMTTASLANRSYASSTGVLDTSGLPAAAVDPAVTETGPGIATLDFGGGTGMSYSRSVMEAPFDANISLSIDVLDADGIAALGNPAVFGGAGGIAFSAGPEIRYGRVRFINGVGSELVDLPVPLLAEHYAGAGIGFVTNTADSCTTNVSLVLTNFTESLSSGDTCVLDTGAPGSSGAGCPAPAPIAQQFRAPPLTGDFNLTLAAPGPGETGSVRIDATVPSWLRFDWDAATPGDENPSGQAAFGLYKGDAGQIYLREVY